MAASENDDDEAQQIQQDRTLALELQVQENIGFATAQRQQVTEDRHRDQLIAIAIYCNNAIYCIGIGT
jgi:hypothetical protein